MLTGGRRNNDFSSTSNNFVGKLNEEEESETSEMSLRKTGKMLTGGRRNNDFSSTSNNFVSKLNEEEESETSEMLLRKTGKLLTDEIPHKNICQCHVAVVCSVNCSKFTNVTS